jgi:hypothetical protein
VRACGGTAESDEEAEEPGPDRVLSLSHLARLAVSLTHPSLKGIEVEQVSVWRVVFAL